MSQNPHTGDDRSVQSERILSSATPGGNLNQSLDGGATWSGINWTTQFSATDIPWLATTGTLHVESADMVFDQLVPNKLGLPTGVGVWNTTVPQNFHCGTPVVWNSQSAGIEQLVANEIVVRAGRPSGCRLLGPPILLCQ